MVMERMNDGEGNERDRWDYKTFLGAYQDLTEAGKQLEGIKENFAGSAQYALKFAKNHLKKPFDDMTAREFLNSPYNVQETLESANQIYSIKVGDIFGSSKDRLIREAPNKGLAAIAYDVVPLEVEGNDSHNQIAKTHAKARSLEGLLGELESGKMKDEDFLKNVGGIAVEQSIRAIDADPVLKGNEEAYQIAASLNQGLLLSSRKLAIAETQALAKNYRKDFDAQFGDDKAKAAYARESIRQLAESGDERAIGMAIALLGKAGEEKKDKKKK